MTNLGTQIFALHGGNLDVGRAPVLLEALRGHPSLKVCFDH